MTIFAEYAQYYDLLYKDKPYAQEAAYVSKVLRKHAPGAKSLIDLGCGSGVHACCLAQEGFQVYGVDQSELMLERARTRAATLSRPKSRRLSFHKGDVRDVQLSVRVDAVLSLFHVVSYQTTNADVSALFETAAKHLHVGGIFFFDVWYGPAVLTDRPVMRLKELEDDKLHITRMATPTMYPTLNLVDVHYRLVVRSKVANSESRTEEHHLMRYFFTPELQQFAASAGFEVVDSHVWLTEASPGFDSWSVSFVCRK